jgi:hypothetical protein
MGLVWAFALASISLAACSESSDPPPSPTSEAVAVPPEGVAYAEALNSGDKSALASVMWYPGPDYPDVDPVDADAMPDACVDAEMALFEGLTVDVSKLRAERRVIGAVPEDDPGVVLSAEFHLLWLDTGGGEEFGRQFATVGGRVAISPQADEECARLAAEQFGGPDR